MINRRSFILCLSASLSSASQEAIAHRSTEPFAVDPIYLPQRVDFPSGYAAAGTIIVDTASRFLYLVEELGSARRYGIGVGRAGLAWAGTAEVGRKAKWPSWTPTANMIRREPDKYARYANGVPGGPSNPLGSRALYLYRNGQDTYYRIHGTTEPWTIGKAVSNGCIRLINEHVEDLYERVQVGTTVVVRHGNEIVSGNDADDRI
jgi:lipoprotein-anchoring transpeptidase ErfK/SrfK